MQQYPFEQFSFRLVSRCPMCGAAAQQGRFELLQESDDGSALVYSACSKCGIGLIACLSSQPHGMYGAAILTDLQRAEIGAYADQDALSADEVMSYVQWLHNKE